MTDPEKPISRFFTPNRTPRRALRPTNPLRLAYLMRWPTPTFKRTISSLTYLPCPQALLANRLPRAPLRCEQTQAWDRPERKGSLPRQTVDPLTGDRGESISVPTLDEDSTIVL